jgi:hypothetical protein
MNHVALGSFLPALEKQMALMTRQLKDMAGYFRVF